MQAVFLNREYILPYFQYILRNTELKFGIFLKQYDYLDFLELVGLSFHGI